MKTAILFGKPGSGKGTQRELLRSHFDAEGVISFEWAEVLTEFMNEDGLVQQRTREVENAGGRLPTFLAPSIWLPYLRDRITGNQHLIIDGVPRHPLEAELLESLFDFSGRTPIHVIHLDLPDTVAADRLRARGREKGRPNDMSDDAIQKRLAWFESDTLPLLGTFRSRSRYRVTTVDGSRTKEEVFDNILKAIN